MFQKLESYLVNLAALLCECHNAFPFGIAKTYMAIYKSPNAIGKVVDM
jgi:hypothetical protein